MKKLGFTKQMRKIYTFLKLIEIIHIDLSSLNIFLIIFKIYFSILYFKMFQMKMDKTIAGFCQVLTNSFKFIKI